MADEEEIHEPYETPHEVEAEAANHATHKPDGINRLDDIFDVLNEIAGTSEAILGAIAKHVKKQEGIFDGGALPKYQTEKAKPQDAAVRKVSLPQEPQVPTKLFDILRDKESITFLRINKGFSLSTRGFTQTPGWWTCINPQCNIMRDHQDICPGCQWDKDIFKSIQKAFKKKVNIPKKPKSTRVPGLYDHLFDGPGTPEGDDHDD